MLHILRGGAKAVVAATAAGLALSVISTATAYAATAPSGVVTLIDPATNTALPNSALGSNQTFQPKLPATGVCPAISSAGEKVYSFMVPAGGDPTTLSFASGVPSNAFPSGDYAGYFDNTGTYWVSGGGTTDATGHPNNIPQMNWGAAISNLNLTTADLMPGGLATTWETGIICVSSNGTPTTTFWDPPIQFSPVAVGSGAGQDPNGFKWTPNPTGNPPVPESPLTIALPIGGLLVLGTGVVVNRRRHASRKGELVSAA